MQLYKSGVHYVELYLPKKTTKFFKKEIVTLVKQVELLFWHFDLDLWSRTISYSPWSWTIRTLQFEEYFKFKWSRTIVGKSILLKIIQQTCSQTLEYCAFQIWFLNIFDLENSPKLWIIQDHKVLMVPDHVVLDLMARRGNKNVHLA